MVDVYQLGPPCLRDAEAAKRVIKVLLDHRHIEVVEGSRRFASKDGRMVMRREVYRLDDETEDELIDAYGREKIGANDSIIILKSVAPRFDAEGDMIFHKDWPENQTPK